MYNIYIETYGCSANQNNSEIIVGMLAKAGLFIVKNADNADFLILNTCVVKGPTEQRMRSRIQELSKIKKPLIVTGCMPDVESNVIKKINPFVNLVGVHHIKDILNVVRKVIEGKNIELISKKDEVKLNTEKIPKSRIIGITQISEGCIGQCAYCYTRLAKGKLFSYPKDLILESVKKDIESGCKEIWLTSQDCAAYGLDKGKRELPELLRDILKPKKRTNSFLGCSEKRIFPTSRAKFFIRLGMMNPNNVKPMLNKLIECYKDKKMFKFLHIPLQSGSDSVLEDMRRNYNVKDFIEIVNAFRKEIPDILISTDIICGYPTETEKDFEETLNIIKNIKPNIVNTSKFWAMPKTKAARLKQLSSEEIKKRSVKMTFLHKQNGLEINKALLGKEYSCIIDDFGNAGKMVARNINYLPILLNSGKIGEIVNVKVTGYNYNYLIGEIISSN